MKIALDLKLELEEFVKAEAQARGLSVEDYIQQELESKLRNAPPERVPYGERLRRFNEWVNSHDYINAPPLSDEAISRESIYKEREDAQL